MWAYLTHYLWIILFVKNVIIVYKFDLKAAAPLTFIGTEIQIFATERMVSFLVGLCKKRKQKEDSRPNQISFSTS